MAFCITVFHLMQREDLAQGPLCLTAPGWKFNYSLPWVAARWKQIMDMR